MKKYKVILFDSDDTLLDFQSSQKYALEKTFKEFKLKYNSDLNLNFKIINDELWKQYNQGIIKQEVLTVFRFEKLFNMYNINCNAKQFSEKYLENLKNCSILLEDSELVCDYLSKKIDLSIITNAVLSVAKSKIEKSGISKYMSNIFVSGEIGYRKPQKEFFDYVLDHLENVSKEEILIVGDSLESDIQGGINVQIDTCWFNKQKIKNNTSIEPKYEINDLKELLILLK